MPDPKPETTDLLVPFGQFPTAANLLNMTPEVMIRPDVRFYSLSVLFRDALEHAGQLGRSIEEMTMRGRHAKVVPSRVEAIAGAITSKTQMLKTAAHLIKEMGVLKVKELDPWIKEHGQGGALEQLNKANTLAEVEAIMAKARGHLDKTDPG